MIEQTGSEALSSLAEFVLMALLQGNGHLSLSPEIAREAVALRLAGQGWWVRVCPRPDGGMDLWLDLDTPSD